ncbi:MAG: GNAT family N-acetyltransferase [Ignavibacteria bacterium]|nr:GNAT family N-acetyltransferase [Ignavibacteria bacterium]MBT8381642.1 GNAT family N-acetyltransferase [Ignavibacteria bacterium]MBT8391203.1 GNAT family N-acetyltransferase [Ignavibacteria bacterium]NNJ51839.1 GNAT family N-acetyltransferase [Ignavibacteriaceae bacterium]NNL19761.1 GNAT family N-acetyltransferase [Ignavibacteriaceae bacterium]
MRKVELIKIDSERGVRENGLGCLTNQKHPGFESKLKWLKKEFENGLRMIILKIDGKSTGMIEYTPSEFFWRPVKAKNYLLIHCLWIVNSKLHKKGYGSLLIKECVKEAKQKKLNGVGVVTSDGPWMAGKKIFLKNGFKQIEEKGRFELLIYQLKKGERPVFINWTENQISSKDFKVIYANQCPMFAKCIPDLKYTAKNKKVNLKFSEIKKGELARNAPTGYGVMSIIKNKKVFADHYISARRFENIMNKEQLNSTK